MAFSIETKNSATFTGESKNDLGSDPLIGMPIGLLLALTYAEDHYDTGYTHESENSASFTFESKNNS